MPYRLSPERIQEFEDEVAHLEREGGKLELALRVYRRTDGNLAIAFMYASDQVAQLRAALAEAIAQVRENKGDPLAG